jgi:structure-specific recognition protein 1
LYLAGNLAFDVDNKQAFEVPLKNVSNSNKGKNEITLQFHQADDARVSLMEIRFYVPPNDGEGDAVEVITQSNSRLSFNSFYP